VIGRAKKKRRKFARKKKKFTASNTEQSEELPEERRLGATSTRKLNHRGHGEKPQAIGGRSQESQKQNLTSLGTLREGQVLETIL
jgi:hypothetical protein